MTKGTRLRLLALMLFSTVLVACGGGGSSDNSPRLSVSKNNISFSATQDDDTPSTASITATVSNANQSLYVGVFYSNTGISYIDYNISDNSGTIYVYPRSPESLAPRTYTDAIEIHVCLDSMCKSPIAGSPQIVNVTYAVTASNPISAIPNHLSFEGVEGQTVSQQTINLSVATGQVPTWATSISNLTGGGWINLTEDHVANTIDIDVTPQAAGNYAATLNINYNSTSGQSRTLAIPISYQATEIWSIASGTRFSIDANTQAGALTKSLPININPDFGGNISYTVSSDSPWLHVSPGTGHTATNQNLTLVVDSNALASMDNGSYQAIITLTSPGYPSKTATVDMSLILPIVQKVSPYITYSGINTPITLIGTNFQNASGSAVFVDGSEVEGISFINDTHASITLSSLTNGEHTVGIGNALGITPRSTTLQVRPAPTYFEGELSLPGIVKSFDYDTERDVFYAVFWGSNFAKKISHVGSSWQIDDINVPNPQAITLTADGQELLVTTSGCGVYRIDPGTLTQMGSSNPGCYYDIFGIIHAFANGRVLVANTNQWSSPLYYPDFTATGGPMVHTPNSLLSYNRNRMLWAESPTISAPREIYYYDEATNAFTSFHVNDPETYFLAQFLALNADGTRVMHRQDVYQDFNYVGSLDAVTSSLVLPTLTRDGKKAVVLDIESNQLSQYDLSGDVGPFPKIGSLAGLSDSITTYSRVFMAPNDQTVFVFGDYLINTGRGNYSRGYKLYIRNLP